MKKYYVRLKDYSGSIIDGAAYEAKNKKEAKQFYLNRCENLKIAMRKSDYITIDQK
ncbi:hypothetical protein [Mammaliicoccus vitulinus]|uniref:hypothetical protein n=1 Tax=Mammaliicoccus vitulinus TaxID=71237 RepID=UPI00248B1A77|nr:hypothetical protein [Mammaliicoccus vitulinus]